MISVVYLFEKRDIRLFFSALPEDLVEKLTYKHFLFVEEFLSPGFEG